MAWGAAALTFLGTAFLIALGVQGSNNDDGDNCTFEKFRENVAAFGDASKAECLRDRWEDQQDQLGLEVAFNLVEALGAILVVPVAIAVGEVFGNRSFARFAVPALALAAFITSFELLVTLGEATTETWLGGDGWNLSDDGLRVLTIASIVARGQNTWIFAFDELLLGVGLTCFSIMNRRDTKFPWWHTWVGFIAGILSLVNFALAVARFGDWFLFSVIEGLSAALVGFILFPLWLAVVGWYITSVDASPSSAGFVGVGGAASGADDGI